MSYKAYDWVWTHEFGSTTAKLVMMALAKHADEKGKSWPKVQTLAKFCGISSRTVQRQIKEFERAGLLTIQKEYRDDGGQTTNRYFINLPSAKALAPTDKAVTGGMTSTTPLPKTALCRGGNDTAMTYQELPTEPKKEILQTTENTLRYPTKLKASDSVWIVKLLQDVPKQDAQLLLDELAAALNAERIKGPSSRWFYGLLQNYYKGNFCPLAKPSKPKLNSNSPTIETNNGLNVRSEIGANTLNGLKRQTRNKSLL